MLSDSAVVIGNPEVKKLKIRQAATTIPDKFKLYQNSPNPFNPITQIRYEIPTRSQVEITIYDALGKKVKSLVSAEQEAGFHEVSWDATDDTGAAVASGIFFYHFSAGKYFAARKMVVLR